MPSYKTNLTVDGETFATLKDILPDHSKPLDILFIGKTPVEVSVNAGHYFQGRQGKMFWGILRSNNILKVKPNTYEDENLLDHNYGITDLVKKPHPFNSEPSPDEYKAGLSRLMSIINKHKPKIIVFVYKGVLDNILKYNYSVNNKSLYGLNKSLGNIFKSNVFVFPMPGTPCTREQSLKAITDLKQLLSNS
jgi:mismatch-specific thymine-DNA glycosylase